MTATTKISKADGEYRVRLFLDGVYQAGADYFTDDRQDATDTSYHMVDHAGPSDKTTQAAMDEQIDFDVASGMWDTIQ